MSGGSYDYLCFNTDDLSSRTGAVQAMADRLEASGYYAAARSTRNVLLMLQAAERTAGALADVWQAVEWKDSNDWSEERVREAVAAFVPWPPELPTDQSTA